MIWKVKLNASLLHVCATVVTSGLVALIAYVLWYPVPFDQLVGGKKILFLIILSEFLLGPVSTFIVYNPQKKKSLLITDYLVIVAIQLTALAYGVYALAEARPIYVVFVKDRLEVVTAARLFESDIQKIRDAKIAPSWDGPKLICVDYPSDPEVRSELLWSGLAGRDIQLLPEYYRVCLDGEVQSASLPKKSLELETNIGLSDLPAELVDKEFTWLPLVSQFGVWMAIYFEGEKVRYLNLDPFSSVRK